MSGREEHVFKGDLPLRLLPLVFLYNLHLHSSLSQSFHWFTFEELRVCSPVQPCLLQSTHHYASNNIFIEQYRHSLPINSLQLILWHPKVLLEPDGGSSPSGMYWVAPGVSSQSAEAGMPLRACLRGEFNSGLNCIDWLLSKLSSSSHYRRWSLPACGDTSIAAAYNCDLSYLITTQKSKNRRERST